MRHRLGLVDVGLLDAALGERRAEPGVDAVRERGTLREAYRQVPHRRYPSVGGIRPLGGPARQPFKGPLQGEVMRRIGPAQRMNGHASKQKAKATQGCTRLHSYFTTAAPHGRSPAFTLPATDRLATSTIAMSFEGPLAV